MKQLKELLLAKSLKIRQLFGLSFDYSLYFDQSNFERRQNNLIGLSDLIVDQFKEAVE